MLAGCGLRNRLRVPGHNRIEKSPQVHVVPVLRARQRDPDLASQDPGSRRLRAPIVRVDSKVVAVAGRRLARGSGRGRCGTTRRAEMTR